MALWFGVSFVDAESYEVLSEQIHGPYEDTEILESAIEEKMDETSSFLEDVIPVAIRFELCSDDVPEVVS